MHAPPSTTPPPPPPPAPDIEGPPTAGPARPPTAGGGSDRTGAIWVTAAGALLLFASAATFVAVRWDQLEDWHKFSALVVVTQLLLAGGWMARRRLPATGAALFSLGAVLVPLDAWTVAAYRGGSWHAGLFVGGLVALVTIPAARRMVDTVALRWSWVATGPLAAAGVAAVVPDVPSAALLAVAGLVALALGHVREGRAWSAIGGAAPVVVLLGPVLPVGSGVLADLGLVGPWVPWATAATAAVLLVGSVIEARHRRVEVVATFVALAAADVVLALVDGDVTPGGWWLCLAGGFVGVQLAATACSSDDFWGPRLRSAVDVAAIASVVAGGVLAITVLGGPAFGAVMFGGVHVAVSATEGGLVATLFALGWLVADEREGRLAGRSRPLRDLLVGEDSFMATWAATGFAALAVVAFPLEALATRAGLVALGAVVLLSRRSGGSVAGTGALIAGILPFGIPGVVFDPFGPPPPTVRALEVAAVLLALAALAVGARRERSTGAAVAMSSAAATGLAVWTFVLLEHRRWALPFGVPIEVRPATILCATAVAGLALGTVAWSERRTGQAALAPWTVAAGAVCATFAPQVHPGATTAIAVVASLWWTVEAVRRNDALPAWIAAVVSPTVTLSVSTWLGLDVPWIGVAASVGAVVLTGLAITPPGWARRFQLTGAAAHILCALVLAAPSPTTTGVVVTVAGLLLVALAVVDRRTVLGYNGAGLALLGTWQTLASSDVVVAEAYLAPLALVLTLAGVHARSTRPASSWVAFVPPVAVLGGGAMLVRLDGGPAWHALVAGAVAVVAIVAGSWLRLAGPLFAGSFLLAAVTVNETVRATAGVPTWIWLAVGGLSLLGAGVAMELRGLGPIESGRRLVELVHERFE